MTILIRRCRRIADRPRHARDKTPRPRIQYGTPFTAYKSTRRRQIAITRSILLNCVEPFLPTIDITMGDEVPVYSRASHSRIVATVVALLLTATAGAVAREFRAAETQSEWRAGAIDLNRTNVALGTLLPSMNVPAVPFPNRVRPVRSIADIGGLRLRVQLSELMSDMIRSLGAAAAMAGSDADAQRDAAAARPIERIRKVE